MGIGLTYILELPCGGFLYTLHSTVKALYKTLDIETGKVLLTIIRGEIETGLLLSTQLTIQTHLKVSHANHNGMRNLTPINIM